jgi:hypothetical protein
VTYCYVVCEEVELHMAWLSSMLYSKIGSSLIQQVVIHLTSKAWPWVLGLPYEHSSVMCPHPCVPAFNQGSVLMIICKLGLQK